MLQAQSYVPAKTFSEKKHLQDFLCAEVVYPEDALGNGVEGKVVLSFTVKKDGQVSDLIVKRKVSPDLDKEAIRLFRMILREPALKYGMPVSSSAEFPVDFNIRKYNKHCKQRGYITTTYPYEPFDTSGKVYDFEETDKQPKVVFENKGMTLERFIEKNIKYPEAAYRQNLSGKVVLKFVVEPQGRISNLKVISPIGGGCTQEAIRILYLLQWMPGIKDDMAVRTFSKLEISFKLPEDSDVKMFEGGQMQSH
jgi:TonB family protein